MNYLKNSYTRFNIMLFGMMMLFLPVTAICEDASPSPVIEAPTPTVTEAVINMESPTDFDKLIDSIGGNFGAGSLGIVIALVQILMFLLKSRLGKVAGKWRLSIVYLLTMVLGVLSLKLQGLTLLASFFHSNTAATLQVFINQVVKQANKKD